MSNFFEAPTINFKTTTLNGAIDDSVQTIAVNSATNLVAPGYIIIDRVNAAGTSTPDSREVIYYTGISTSNLTGCVRGADGSTARSHSDGAIVETTFTVGMWNDMVDILGVVMTKDSALKSYISPVSIARVETAYLNGAFINGVRLAVSSIASIAEIQTPKITATKFAGHTGQFVWTTAGSLTTSRATAATDTHLPFLRARKDLTVNNIWAGVNSAPSLSIARFDIAYAATPTSSLARLGEVYVDIGESTSDSAVTAATIAFSSLASGMLIYPSVGMHGGSGDLTLTIDATER